MNYYLTVALHSDATFGRGDGVPGLVDLEIDHDEAGCPFIGGRALKGLLLEEWANIRFALGDGWERWQAEAEWLFGRSGATTQGAALLHIGPALLPSDLRAALHAQVADAANALTRELVLDSLTAIRRQTAVDVRSGAPEEGALRAIRVLLRETPLIARLECDEQPSARALALLAACTLTVRRGGTGRNRGRGRLSLLLHDSPPRDYADSSFMHAQFDAFAALLREAA